MLGALVTLAGLVPRAHAEVSCDDATTDSVSFAVAANFEPAFAEAARAHLAAELGPRGLAVCLATEPGGPSRPAPRALLSVSGDPDGEVTLRIEDAATRTIVTRTLDFSAVPPPGRAVAFGLAADELLAAGWTNLALRARRTPAAAGLPAVAAPGAAPAAPIAAADRFIRLSIAMAGDHYGGGLSLTGPDLQLALDRGPLSGHLRAGARWSTALAGPHGDVTFSDWHAALGLSALVLGSHHRLGLGPLISLETARVNVRGIPDGGATARQGTGWALIGRVGVTSFWQLSSAVRLALDLTGGQVIRPVYGADSGTRLGGVQGWVATAALSAGVAF